MDALLCSVDESETEWLSGLLQDPLLPLDFGTDLSILDDACLPLSTDLAQVPAFLPLSPPDTAPSLSPCAVCLCCLPLSITLGIGGGVGMEGIGIHFFASLRSSNARPDRLFLDSFLHLPLSPGSCGFF